MTTSTQAALPDAFSDPKAGAERFRLSRHLWILRRVLLSLVTLFLISVLIFLATHLLPGDAARAVAGPHATPEQYDAVRQSLGLDRPMLGQYGHWLADVLRGQLGTSLITGSPVTSLIWERLVNTLALLLGSASVSIPLSILIGVGGAVRPNGVLDTVSSFAWIALAGMPQFVTGILLIALFATSVFTFLPAVSLVPESGVLSDPAILVLPVATLTLSVVPYLSRLVRGAMIDALQSEYVAMAQLKGLPARLILFRHALRNGLIPAIQGTALSLAYLFGGVVIVEYIFSFQGLGTGLIDAVNQRDVPVIQAIVLIFGAGYVVFNLLADVLTVYVTPRLRTK